MGGEVGDWRKEGEGISQEHTCMTHGHRQHRGDGLREEGVRAGWRWAKGEKWGQCTSIKNKNKV